MSWRGEKLHALVRRLGKPNDSEIARELFDSTHKKFEALGVAGPTGWDKIVQTLCAHLIKAYPRIGATLERSDISAFIQAVLDYEGMFALPQIDWQPSRQTSDWWKLREAIAAQSKLVEDFDRTLNLLAEALAGFLVPIVNQLPPLDDDRPLSPGTISVDINRRDMIAELGETVGHVASPLFEYDLIEAGLLPKMRHRFERNLIAASGGNPDDPAGFRRQPVPPQKSGIKDRDDLIMAYLAGTPLAGLFEGSCRYAVPAERRFEHHHIVAGTGHGKTQTLQYLIARDLEAVAAGAASVIVIDSQGDLINNLSSLKLLGPGQPLEDRIVIIDPTDVEYPVSLNMFDVGLERLQSYPMLERERLTNSILELYDFVLGTLLDAGMTQKQSVIFRYVTRLMLHIPDATIHTLRELMEPDGALKYAGAIAKLQGSARHFFETEFNSREFQQTKSQVLRRLWGILENQTFERMFSHPRSRFDLFSEMNKGKLILINTAKDLLKETGTQIFGRFFIALIAQAAQERATLAPHQRLPTFVYVDEAADYFDQNIGIILSQARKFNVGMVLAHQFLGQLSPALQDAFAANTAIKFAGGVSSKDARTLASMIGCEPTFIEKQRKGEFAASVRGQTQGPIALRFPFGHVENMPTLSPEERQSLINRMRRDYAVHYTELGSGEPTPETTSPPPKSDSGSTNEFATPKREAPADPDRPDTDAGRKW